MSVAAYPDTNRIPFYIRAILWVTGGVFLDQLVKYIAITQWKGQDSLIVIPGVFQLTYLENRGAAFGILQGKKFFFLVSALVILLAAVWFYKRVPMTRRFLPMRVCTICIVIGAIGNLTDRLRLNYVVDMFYFELINFPVFNVADVFVTVATIILALLILFYYKEEDFEPILHRRIG